MLTIVTLTHTLMILILFIVPIYILYHLVSHGTERAAAFSIGVLVAFTLAFSAVLSLFTRAKRHEILAAAAA